MFVEFVIAEIDTSGLLGFEGASGRSVGWAE
jgi:uncharacterized membrane protein YtjA (UPF0391 family)